MNKFSFFIIMIVFDSLAIADDCSTHKTESDCYENPSCSFIPSGSSCINKCDSLSQSTCTNDINKNNCEFQAGGGGVCGLSFDCTTLSSNQQACQANPICLSNNLQSCTMKGNTLFYECLQLSQVVCESNYSRCIFYPSYLKFCSYRTGQCFGLSEAACDVKYCDKYSFVCQSYRACSSYIDELSCSSNEPNDNGCKWYNSVCNDSCNGLNPDICNARVFCNMKTLFNCQDKQFNVDPCISNNSLTLCLAASSFCSVNSQPDQCSAKPTFCSDLKTQNECQAYSAYCSFNPSTETTCKNIVTAETCSSITSETACQNTTGCKWKPSLSSMCQNKVDKRCNPTDSYTHCVSSTQHCRYITAGTCSTTSKSVYLTVASSILIFLIVLW